ncbi:hypothetical protein AB0C02_24520 [Micromonospora sp. NPDC048999]|uniref:hypothetical protein n=1 Tax=Micromonospora sp. NPDC048999 TaxID=3155391 RepID=UPI0033D7516B
MQIDAIDSEAATRLINTVMAAVQSRRQGQAEGSGHLRVETVYDEERASLKIIILGGLNTAADLLKVIDTPSEEPE